MAVGLCVGGYYYADFHGSQGRKLDGEAGHKLVMVQGLAPQPGRPALVEFWGTYCPPCIASIPHLNELYSQFGPRVQFVAVSSEDFSVVKGFMARQRISYPVAVDSSHEFFSAWDVSAVPTLIFMDADQKVKWRGHSMEMTSAKLASLLNGS